MISSVYADFGSSLDTDIIAYYNFDENSGLVADDATNNQDGVIGASVDIGVNSCGKINTGYNFTNIDKVSNNNQWVNITGLISSTQNISMSFWATSLNNDERVVFSTEGNEIILYESQGTNGLGYFDGQVSLFNSILSGNTLQHIVFTLENTTGNASLYVDGVLNASDLNYDNFANINGFVMIGAATIGTNNIYGCLDEVGIWERVLTPSEVSELYNGGAGKSFSQVSTIINSPETVSLKNVNLNVTSKVFRSGTELKNVTLYINGALNETREISGTSNISIFTNKFNVSGLYNISFITYDNESIFTTSTNTSFSFQDGIVNIQNHSASTFETAQETFNANFTFFETVTSVISNLEYNGTNYTGNNFCSSNTCITNRTIDIPVSTISSLENRNVKWYFQVTSGSGTITQVSNTTVQEVNETIWTVCNVTYSTQFLNISFRDELNLSILNASIPLATFEYYLGGGTVNKTYTLTDNTPNGTFIFCAVPVDRTLNVNSIVQYEQNPSYPQRIWHELVKKYSDTLTDQVLNLLHVNDGQYITFQVINVVNQPINNVISTASRNINGIKNVVGSGLTDSAGAITFWLNPNFIYDYIFSRNGFSLFESSFAPTQNQYTITLTSTRSTPNDYFQGIDYLVLPQIQTLFNDTSYDFGFNMTSNFWILENFGFQLRLANGTVVGTQTSTIEGTAATFNYDVNNQTIIYMDYFWLINDTYTNATRYWVVQNSLNTDWSILNFFSDLNNYLSVGFFGIDDFGRIVIVYIVLFFSIGVMSFKYGIRSPVVLATMMFAIIFFFDVTVDLIPTIRGIENLPTYLMGLATVSLIFKEAMTR